MYTLGLIYRNVYRNGQFRHENVYITDQKIAEISSSKKILSCDRIVNCTDMLIMPGFIDPHEHPKENGVVSSAHRYRGVDMALGKKTYIADMEMDEMIHGDLLLSEHPRAKVIKIDTSKAKEACGAIEILTAGDVAGAQHQYDGKWCFELPLARK